MSAGSAAACRGGGHAIGPDSRWLPAAFVNSLAVPFLTTRMWAAGLGKEEKLSPKREKI